jgi:hypothetical protein
MHRRIHISAQFSILVICMIQGACTVSRQSEARSASYVVWPASRGGGEVLATWQRAIHHIALLEQRIAERLADERRALIKSYVFRYFGVEDDTGVYILCFGDSEGSAWEKFLKVPEPGDPDLELIPVGPHAITAKYDVGRDRLTEFKFGPIL